MSPSLQIELTSPSAFADKLSLWLKGHEYGLILRNNSYRYNTLVCDALCRYELLAGVGAAQVISPQSNSLEALKHFKPKGLGWLFGYLGYDLKNEIESLSSVNTDGLGFPDLLFFEPQLLFAVTQRTLTIHYDASFFSAQTVRSIYNDILNTDPEASTNPSLGSIQSRLSRSDYMDTVDRLKQHLGRGDLYEVNFCQEFFDDRAILDPHSSFNVLNGHALSAFAAFGCFNQNYLLCASPERYLQRKGNRLTSQPMKGTSRRGLSPEEDHALQRVLSNDPKERAENIMIVDLVRNDLARVAVRGSVRVEELCGIYPFQHVNQMISTVSCDVPAGTDAADIIEATFPMGSMTGAPKLRAMELIERYERSKRGIYSGAVGYIEPNGDFDFNVVIRSLLYNQQRNYLSFSVGSAITMLSNSVAEYDECLLKASAILKTLGVDRDVL